MLTLTNKDVQIVDTTCPWVSKVWNIVEKHKKEDYTSIIHGVYGHEETVAIASFAWKHVVVQNVDDVYKCFALVFESSSSFRYRLYKENNRILFGSNSTQPTIKGEFDNI
ncbi:1-hydroxy-2-methyl-2-(E)-butenyl 4-diphosphate reductase [Prunus yedoensis var. nudiflora]|uniref:4-hydroxy-3-methylbut-2-enyl diphosphate reductase n=1 Tax=Prunus yedoensis var. nudiflora TaxID=2094558 RepID=A0A314UBJ4_PRUYE|nr:1-hydroxy-2-methyl-2-(E)-butenyl 4-diphosphate reductase [Prunus yedoensis var. nudiflora]